MLPQLWSSNELVGFFNFLRSFANFIRFDAHDYCLDIGGYLVEIDTEEEEDWLLGAFAVYDQVGETRALNKKNHTLDSCTHTPYIGLLDWID